MRGFQVSSNGLVSFNAAITAYTPTALPTTSYSPFVAVYWSDVDISRHGRAYYRATTGIQRRIHAAVAFCHNYTVALVFGPTTNRVRLSGPPRTTVPIVRGLYCMDPLG